MLKVCAQPQFPGIPLTENWEHTIGLLCLPPEVICVQRKLFHQAVCNGIVNKVKDRSVAGFKTVDFVLGRLEFVCRYLLI